MLPHISHLNARQYQVRSDSIAMQQRQKQQHTSERIFTASEVAEYEYCPLAWWYEQYEPLAQVDNEELFAYMVELEHDHGSQAPALPEYQVMERLLVRRGAFEEGTRQHLEHAEQVADVAEIEDERVAVHSTNIRFLMFIALGVIVLALLLIVVPLLLRLR